MRWAERESRPGGEPGAAASSTAIKNESILTCCGSLDLGERAEAAASGWYCDAELCARQRLDAKHEHRCARCKHPLTAPLSIERGYGPTCWQWACGVRVAELAGWSA